MQTVFFISDLHLRPQGGEANQFLEDFLQTQFIGKSDSLYILGDYFDFWIGDDGADNLGYGKQLEQLKQLTEKSISVYFMHGNRDFLVGNNFSEITGVKILADPTTIELQGKQCLLKHGDDLCTDDIEHQKFRIMTRDPAWQQAVLSKSIDERLAMASQIRQMSGSSYKPSEIMDVNEDCIKQTFADQDVEILIHGHTHRPGIHDYSIENKSRQRIVLGDWHNGISYLKVDEHGFNLFNSD